MQLAKLSQDEAKVVKTLLSLEGADNKKASRGTFSLKFDSRKVKCDCILRAVNISANLL